MVKQKSGASIEWNYGQQKYSALIEHLPGNNGTDTQDIQGELSTGTVKSIQEEVELKESDTFEDPLTNIENLKQFAPHSGDQCILLDKENPKSEQLAILYKLCMHLQLFCRDTVRANTRTAKLQMFRILLRLLSRSMLILKNL